jgi:4-hydroxy-tetrahydrodipicolinate reductase
MRVVQVGLGPIGRGIAIRVRRTAGLELVGAVDPRPDIAGRDLGEVLGAGPSGVRVAAEVAAELDRARPDLVLHATGSHLDTVAGEIEQILDRGVSIVSTCEELAYPFQRNLDHARRLDARARERGAVLLGTGVNPGFAMDKLVVTLAAACDAVRTVRVTRVLDAAKRREPFQRKVGGGLTPAEFERRRAAGALGHVGLAESAHMIADAIGLAPKREIRETLRPVIASEPVASAYLRVAAGQVAGIDQTATLLVGGEERIGMALRMFLGAPRSFDAVKIQGEPPLEMEISTGVPGDEATCAIVVHCAPLVPALAPGLRTMLDVPLRPARSTGA